MEKKIPIDKLFHDQLANGKEQLNLGAWANMERMLDGKNPYAVDEEKKRRGLFPLFIALLVTLGITGTTYLVRHGLPDGTPEHHTSLAENHATPPEVNHNIPASLNQDANHNETGMNAVANEDPQKQADKSTSLNKKSTATHRNSHSSAIRTINHPTSASTASAEPLNTPSTIHSSEPGDQSNVAVPAVTRQTRKLKARLKHTDYADQRANTQQASAPAVASNDAIPDPQPINKLVKTIPMLTVNQTTVMGRNGNLEMRNDTVDRSTYKQEIEVPAVRPQLDWTQTNPRYKSLNQEEERNAAYHQEPNATVDQVQSTTEVNTMARVIESTSSTTQKHKQEQHSGAMDNLVQFASRTFEKVNNILLYKAKPDLYTSLLMGVNASLNSAKNNFGGFQGGLSFLRPVNDYVSFITECKFYYRKNGGYTANDIYYNILDPQIDTVSLGHIQQTAYSYQKDSIIKTYNFKNFYSFELPLMMQLNYRSFALYGGVNLAYSLRLNTTEKSRNYVNTYHDTLPSASAYSFPVERASQYMRSDFASRFGVGYTVGASYSFSPQLYLDLRVAQNVWDNSKTNAAREVSSGFFKVPSIQFSLGYRFRDFTPDN